MFEDGVHQVRFAVGLGGYNREAVDTAVKQCELSMSDTRAQLERTEASVLEADERVQALEARLSTLENRGGSGSRLTELVDAVLDKAEHVGRELQSRVVAEAEAERQELQRKDSTEPTDTARIRAEEIVAQAQRQRDELNDMVEESHRQVVELLQEARVMAEERARVTWKKSLDRLRDPVLELAQLHERCRKVLEEVVDLQESVQTSWRHLVSEP